MSRSAYGKPACFVCGRRFSGNGLAQYSHKMWHVRRGEMSKRLVFKGITSDGREKSNWRFDVTPKGIDAHNTTRKTRRLMA